LPSARDPATLPLVKTSLDHLPEAKRRELELVVDVLREEFAKALRLRTMQRYRDGKLLKIILFGSYARGDWVEDPVGRYFSDFDLLIVVNHEDLTDVPEFWADAESSLTRLVGEGRDLRTPVSPIYHSLEDVNEKLRLGRYFFMDILREGVVLFEESGCSFVEPQPLSALEALRETQVYFEEWFESAEDFLQSAIDAQCRAKYKLAAFLLHQATERFYHCLFLVRTLYSPKTHNLNRLREQAEGLEPRLKGVWPTDSKFEKRAYELLRAAYVKARYSRQYRISADELSWLSKRVQLLRDVVRQACESRIETLAEAA
jgi:predicted nucleotidyltransferase/HEPN domain-containing protein